ncbi:MAG: ATP-binding protein [Pseudomonadota bacterium]
MIELPTNLAELLTIDLSTGAVTSREGKRVEFKQAFEPADFSDYTKVLASFANATGGIIVFGISDTPRKIVGSPQMADEADWANRIREDFDPELPFSIRQYLVEGSSVYAIGVAPSLHKPVICKKGRSKLVTDKKGVKKDVAVIQEGAIYYRYAGQSRTINFPELHHMLADREARYLRKMMETLQVIQKVGLENAGVIDMSAPTSPIFMSKETAKGLSFIEKGNIVQEAGAPAYVIMGNVDLRHVVHAPIDEADKNLPSEVAKMLMPLIREMYGRVTGISPSQVTMLLRHLGIDDDNQHCVHERKFRRKYITRAGIGAITDFIRSSPEDALKTFASRAANANFAIRQLSAMPGASKAAPIRVGADIEAAIAASNLDEKTADGT